MVGDWSAPSGYEAGQVFASRSEVTAIIAATTTALGVMRALRERDRDVPGDVSVIGFDDIPEAAYFAPLLTTVRQDFAEVGRRGLGLLVDQIEGRSARSEVYVPTELIVRMSTISTSWPKASASSGSASRCGRRGNPGTASSTWTGWSPCSMARWSARSGSSSAPPPTQSRLGCVAEYPETAAHRQTGHAVPYGARQDINHPHPAFRYLAERLIRKIVGRYADHPAVIGWQVDNEPGINVLHNPAVFEGFREFLRDRYVDVDALNERWGLTYWSHRLHDWADLWEPDGNTTPSYDLAWRRYQAALTHEYIEWQADLVRSLVPGDQFVTTCLALHQPTQDVAAIGSPLDIVAANIYYGTQDDLELPNDTDDQLTRRPSFLPWTGTAWLYLQADISRGARQQPFLVAETNASSIGGSADNFPAYNGQWRQVVWTLVARGARMVEYWHWHSLHYGAETYWGGILGHSLEPGRAYDELSAVAGELRRVSADIDDLRPHSDVAVLVSAESRWAMEFMSPLQASTPVWMGDPKSYERILAAFYRGLFDAGLAVDVVAPAQLPKDPVAMVDRWRALVVPGLYVADDDLLDLLGRYAEAGGHLVLTPRTGFADEEAVVRHTVMPGVLREAVGAHYLEFTNLVSDVPVRANPSGGDLAVHGSAARVGQMV